MATFDIVAAVAKVDPHTAEKPPHAITVASANPPLNRPNAA